MRILHSLSTFSQMPRATFAISVLFFLSISSSAVLFDENFSVMFFGPTFYQNPLIEIPSQAIGTAITGWNSGRFISPLLHFVGGLGFWFTFAVSHELSLNIFFVYGVLRVVLASCVVVLIHILVSSTLVQSGANVTKSNSVGAVIAMASLALLVVNDSSASPRTAPLAYSVAIIFGLIFTLLFLKVITLREKKVMTSGVSIFFSVSLGVLAASTYEVTQLIAPIAIILALAIPMPGPSNKVYLGTTWLGRVRRTEVWAYGLSVILVVLFVRTISSPKCESECYAPAALNLNGLSLDLVFNRFLSSFPGVPINTALSFQELSFENQSLPSLALLAGFLAGLSVAANLIRVMEGSKSGADRERQLTSPLCVLMMGGLYWAVIFSLGAASTVEMQQSGITFGASARDTLYVATGLGIFFGAAIVLIVITVLDIEGNKIRFITNFVVSTTIGVLVVLGFWINAAVSSNSQTVNGQFLNSLFGSEIANPDFSSEGNARRCALIHEKLQSYKNWEGHDRLFVRGLNLSMEIRAERSFCSEPEEDLIGAYYEQR